jgi:D-alanine-D-alanine ligase
MDVGIAFDLRSDFARCTRGPEDRLEEYDLGGTIDALCAALAAGGHRPRRLGGGRAFLEAVLAHPPELVFNVAEGRGSRSREAQVPAVCEMLALPCTHSDPLTLAVTLDKVVAKRLVAAHGIPTAPWAVVRSLEELAQVPLPFPLFVKPCWEGSSMGIRASSRVDDRQALESEVARVLADYQEPALVEAFLPGAELTAGIFGHGEQAELLGVMEIEPRSGAREGFVYSLEVKRDFLAQVRYHAPPQSLSAGALREAERVALGAYRALGCRDVARIDLRLDAAGRPCFVEANPLPGLAPESADLVILARARGLSYEGLIQRIVAEALARPPAVRPPVRAEAGA